MKINKTLLESISFEEDPFFYEEIPDEILFLDLEGKEVELNENE